MVPQKILKVTSPLYYQEEWWFLLLSDIKIGIKGRHATWDSGFGRGLRLSSAWVAAPRGKGDSSCPCDQN